MSSSYSNRNIRASNFQWYMVNQQYIPVIKLNIDTVTYYYVDTYDVYYVDKKIYGLVGSLLAQNDTYDYSGVATTNFFGQADDQLFCQMEKECQMYIAENNNNTRSKRYLEEDLANLKITQAHHTHFRPFEVAKMANFKTGYQEKDYEKQNNKKNKEKRSKFTPWFEVVDSKLIYLLDRVISDIGPIRATVSTVLLYYLNLPVYWRNVFVTLITMTDQATIKLMMKVEGSVSKQSQHVFRHDFNYLFELNVLQNRVEDEIDWEAEKQHRTQLNVAQPNMDKLKRALTAMFSQAKQEHKRPQKYQWDEYWSMRWGISPSGAVHSDYVTDSDVYETIPHRYRTKTTVLSAMPNDIKLAHFISREPRINAHVSTKYEWGKTRALYGCDLTSHLMADFGLHACEDTMPCFIPVGSEANEENIIKLMSRLKNGIPFCYDYDDFNSQHSIESMQAVISTWLDVFECDITADQKAAVLWTMESIGNMSYRDIEGNSVATAGTLFSGWRLTSFVNTALNYAYLKTVGLDSSLDYSLHNGDDVFGMSANLGRAYSLVAQAEAIGIRAQVTKMNIGTISEFLRTDVNSQSPTGRQYLTRGCATAIHARAETSEPTSCLDLIDNNVTRMEAIVKRGGNQRLADKLVRHYSTRIASAFSVDANDIETIRNLHHACGGLSSIRENSGLVVTRVSSGHVDEGASIMVDKMGHAVGAYASTMLRTLKLPRDLLRKNKLEQMAYRSIATQPITFRIGTEDRKVTNLMQALYKAWAPSGVAMQFSKIRSFTATLKAVGALSQARYEILETCENPSLWASVLF